MNGALQLSKLFLTEDEIADFTGIRKGRGGRKKHELQIAWLRKTGLPFFTNARGLPKLARAVVEGRTVTTTQPDVGWRSNKFAIHSAQ